MNKIKSLLQNVVNIKAHSPDFSESSDFSSSVDQIDGKSRNGNVEVQNDHSENSFRQSNVEKTVNPNDDTDCKILQETVFDLIRGIIDPEKPQTLEDLDVVNEEDVFIYRHGVEFWIRLEFTPTVPHCSLASLIGLCLRKKLEECLPDKHKLDIYIKQGTHSTADEINKQINDKERIAAAMENPNLRDLVNRCIAD